MILDSNVCQADLTCIVHFSIQLQQWIVRIPETRTAPQGPKIGRRIPPNSQMFGQSPRRVPRKAWMN